MRGAGIARYAAARRPSPFAAVIEYGGLVVLLLIVIGIALWLVNGRHAARAEAQAVCAREVQLEIKRRPHLDNVVRLADHCLSLARMRGH